MLRWLVFASFFLLTLALDSDLQAISARFTKRTPNGLHLPIVRRSTPSLRKRGTATAVAGLGNYFDITYNVIITVGDIATPLVLDTGSSDLWVVSTACKGDCDTNLSLYPQESFQSSGLDARLLYGDSRTGTHAFGLIGRDKVNLAGLTLQDQYFAAINDTNTSVLDTGSAGIFGLGFPVNSALWSKVFKNDHYVQLSGSQQQRRWESKRATRYLPDLKNLRRPTFTPASALYPSSLESRQTEDGSPTSANAWSQVILSSWASSGPLLPRISDAGILESPMFTVSLQRNSIDVGGNVGMLSIGELPDNVESDKLTWAPLRTYSVEQGGLYGPPDSPGEEYPIPWEVFVDGVYLDGQKLPESRLSPTIKPSALIDTGNSLLRGPSDVVRTIQTMLGPGETISCGTPHTLEFEIGGKRFPVDPRDLVSQRFQDNVEDCVLNLAVTDTPEEGRSYLYNWSLGDPFLKSVVSSYYYGNLTHPSADPPRIGFLSTVPDNANELYLNALQSAKADGNFPATVDRAPQGTPTIVSTNSDGVGEAQPSATDNFSRPNGAIARLYNPSAVLAMTIVGCTAVVLGQL